MCSVATLHLAMQAYRLLHSSSGGETHLNKRAGNVWSDRSDAEFLSADNQAEAGGKLP